MKAMHTAPEAQQAGKRGVGLFGAMAIGIGGMVGGGIFAVLGEAVTLAHGATVIAFLVAGVIALLTSYSYAHLSVHYQGHGGTVAFIDAAFGIDLATGSINLMLWLSYLVTIALYAVAFGSYALTFFHGPEPSWLRHMLISTAIVLPLVINLFNVEVVSRAETLIVVLKLLLLAAVIIAGLPHIQASHFAASTWGNGLTVVAAGMVIFVAYEGFELIANAAGDMRTPALTLPRAFYGSVVLVIILYCLVAAVTVGTVSESEIVAAKDYALAAAARPAMGDLGFTLVGISALLATFSAINATIYGNARLGYKLATDRELPQILEHKAWNEPVSGVLIVGLLSLLIANLIDLAAIAILASAGFLLIFAITNAAASHLAREIGCSRWLPMLASLACLAALLVLIGESYLDDPKALWIFIIFLLVSVLFEWLYSHVLARPLHLAKPVRLPSKPSRD
jgi:amino acid transporter